MEIAGVGAGLGDRVGVGLLPGEAVGIGLLVGVVPGSGVVNATGEITCSVVCAWQVPFQQILTRWSPMPVSRGTTTSLVTSPLPSDRKEKTMGRLQSSISPA